MKNLEQSFTLQEYSNRLVGEIKQTNSLIGQPENITLGNKKGVKVVYQGNDGKKIMKAWTLRDRKAYIFTYTAEKEKYDLFLNEVEKMLDSFKIISPEKS